MWKVPSKRGMIELLKNPLLFRRISLNSTGFSQHVLHHLSLKISDRQMHVERPCRTVPISPLDALVVFLVAVLAGRKYHATGRLKVESEPKNLGLANERATGASLKFVD